MTKCTAWNKIKKEYLEGVTPKELALKYKIKAKSISDKAAKEKWTIEKSKICANILQNTEDRIKGLTNKAFIALEQVLDDEEAEYKDKVAAAKAIIDVSGLKKENHNNNNKNFNFDAPVDEETINNVVEKLKNF